MFRTTPVHPVTLISARVDGVITPGESRFLDTHLHSCASCQQTEAELNAICRMLKTHPVESAPLGAVDRLIGRLRESRPARPAAGASARPREHGILATLRRLGRSPMLAVPAVLILVVVGVLFAMQLRSAAPVVDAVRESPLTATTPGLESQANAERSGAPVGESNEHTGSSEPLLQSAPIAAPAPEPARVATPRVVARPPAPLMHDAGIVASSNAAPERVIEPQAPPPAPTELTASSIRFRGNSKRLNQEARQTIAAAAEWMLVHDEVQLVIEARTDPRRSAEKTLELGRKRTLAVARYLEEQGVDPSRLRQVAYDNATGPVLDDDDDRGVTNDRVDLVPER